jgi:hypothetical protein
LSLGVLLERINPKETTISMTKTLLLSLVALGATAFASGNNTFKLNLTQDSVVEGKTIIAGDYKVSFENGNATLTRGKQSIEVPAREENAASKFPSTSLVYQSANNLSEIRFGGSHTKLVFGGAAASMPSGQ